MLIVATCRSSPVLVCLLCEPTLSFGTPLSRVNITTVTNDGFALLHTQDTEAGAEPPQDVLFLYLASQSMRNRHQPQLYIKPKTRLNCSKTVISCRFSCRRQLHSCSEFRRLTHTQSDSHPVDRRAEMLLIIRQCVIISRAIGLCRWSTQVT